MCEGGAAGRGGSNRMLALLGVIDAERGLSNCPRGLEELTFSAWGVLGEEERCCIREEVCCPESEGAGGCCCCASCAIRSLTDKTVAFGGCCVAVGRDVVDAAEEERGVEGCRCCCEGETWPLLMIEGAF